MQSTSVRCNICEIDIYIKDVSQHTSSKEHQVNKAALESDLNNMRLKCYINDKSAVGFNGY